MKRLFVSLSFCLSITSIWATPSVASDLQIVGVDYGNVQAPQTGAPLPGETRAIYFTLKNTGPEDLQDLVLRGTPGSCLSDLSPSLRLATLAVGGTVRLDTPLSITMSPDCLVSENADLLLVGAYLSSDGSRRSIWATHSFFITGPIVEYDQEQTGLNLTIPDNGGPAVHVEFNVPVTGVVKQVGVEFTVDHRYQGDLEVSLVHPDGTQVVLLQNGTGSGVRKYTYGLGGSSNPTQPLTPFIGKPVNGTWKIRFKDVVSADTGSVKQARLRLK